MKTVSVKSLDELVEAGVIQLTRGKIISKTDMAACPGNYPVYSSAKENDGKFGEYGRFMFDEELITWSVDGGGRLFYRPKHQFSVTNVGGVLRILDRATLDYRYLFYALTLRHSEITFDWVKKAHPSVIRKLYTDIPVPPLPEQQRIVGILDEAFDGIATAKANAEQNLQNARALFESHLQSVFTQRGEGWVERTLDEICIIGDGNHSSNYPRKEELVEVGVPFIRSTNLVDGRIDGTDMRFLSPEKHAQLKKGHLKSGDILITNRGEIGKTAIVDAAYDNANLNSQIAWLRCREEMDNKFLFHVLNSGDIQKHFQSAKSGAALQQFTIKQLRELCVPLPSKKQQQTIVESLDSLYEETQRLESLYQRKLAALDELKKSLLHQAFSGAL